MSLSDRQWNQIRAALEFWNAVARSSRVHPMQHPMVQPYFGDGEPTPLTEDEIEAMLVADVEVPEGATAAYAAGMFDMTSARLLAEFRRSGIRPMASVKGVQLYASGDIVIAIRAIRERDKKFCRKYHVGQ